MNLPDSNLILDVEFDFSIDRDQLLKKIFLVPIDRWSIRIVYIFLRFVEPKRIVLQRSMLNG